MSAALFTIGYEGLDLQVFLNRLEEHGIECLLDIREIPLSRKRGFSKSSLALALEGRGIQYVHIRELGSPRVLREELKSHGDYGRFFRRMERYLTTQDEGIERAYRYIGHTRCCLMCFEKLAATCHRKLVARKIRERDGNGLEVKHL